MRRKLDLAMTLVGNPTDHFLDEPTTGLDPRSRRTMWTIIRELVADGVTVFLTTQYLEEADQLADRIAVLDQGRLVAQGTSDDLKRQIPGRTSGSGSPPSSNSTRPRGSSPASRGTTKHWPCGFPATVGRNRCGPYWTGSTSTRSVPKSSPSTHRTSMTFSHP
jgi:ABC-type multidrug transport system ATPase subunit